MTEYIAMQDIENFECDLLNLVNSAIENRVPPIIIQATLLGCFQEIAHQTELVDATIN